MAYNAEIAIAVKGGEALKKLQNDIQRTAEAVDSANKDLRAVANRTVSSLDTLNATLSAAKNNFNAAARGTEPFKNALSDLIKAEQTYNSELKERNRLLDEARSKQGPSIRGERLTETQQQGRESLQAFFEDAAQQAKNISVAATNTRTAWATFFADAAQQAKNISVSATNTRTSWETFFSDAAQQAKNVKITATNTRSSWAKFFTDASEVAADLQKTANDLQTSTRIRALNIKQSWNSFFEQAEQIAQELKQSSARVSLRAQERKIFVEETISKGRSARIARERSAFLQGSSGTERQGPLAGPGSLGFPVALPGLSKEEQRGLRIAKEKLTIIQRTIQARQQLAGLAQNLQRLDNRAKVSIADANREQAKLNALKQKELELEQEIAKAGRLAAADRQKRRKDAVGSALIGGAFPLLFGQGPGAALGGAAGGFGGGLLGGQFGFGLSLVGTQIGVLFDGLTQGAKDLGAALNPLTADLDKLTEAAGITGSQTAQLIEKLEEAGLSSAALTLATQELESVIGADGVQALRDFATTTQEVGNDVQKLGTILKATIASVFNALVITPDETRLKQEGEAIAAARQTADQNPALQAQFQALDTASSIKERLAARQRILEIIERTNNSLANQALLEQEGNQRAENELRLQIQSEKTRSLRLAAIAAEGVEREKLVDLAAKSALQDQFKLEKQELINQAVKGEISFRAVALKLKDKEIDLQEALAAIDDKTSTRQQKRLDTTLKKQEALLEASARTLQVQQNKFKALGAETRSQQALLSFVSRRAEIERRAEEQIKKIREAGGPTADQAVANIEEAERVALAGERLRLEEAISKVIEGVNRPLDRIIEKNEDQLAFNAEYQELLNSGVTPELAKQLAQIEVIYEKSLDKLNTEIASLEAKRIENKLNEEQIKQLDRLIEQRGILEGKRDKAKETATKVEESKPGKVQAYMDQLKKDLNDTEGMIVSLAQTIEGEIGSAMSTAITNVITGTGTVQEAMSTMFANIGKAFIDMATQMIAKALIMKALGIIAGPSSGTSMFPTDTGGWTAPEGSTPSTLGMNFFGRANGGPVGPNGTYLVGEQGPELLSMGNQPGYVHRNTSEVMDRYRNGGNQGGTAANLSVNYNVTDINGMRFVTEDQFRAGMTKAAKDGAKMGEAGTFKTMKNSRSSRARVGL